MLPGAYLEDVNDINQLREILDFNIKIKNYKIARDCVIKLADKGDNRSIQTLAIYYQIRNDEDNMDKYYRLGIKNNIENMMWYSLLLLKKN